MRIAADIVFYALCAITGLQISRLVYYCWIEPRIAPNWVAHRSTLAAADALTWTCMVCGRRRPDALIGVASYTTSRADLPAITANVRHCTDNLGCADVAVEVARMRAWTLAHAGEDAHG